jgi:type VI protein secretion system component VasK
MAGRISGFLREYVLVFSIILTILGIILLFISITGIWFKEIPENILKFSKEILDWSLYLLIIGFIVFVAGVYYLYSFLKNRKFLLDEIKTNKRSELIKKHAELKNTVRHLPSKYQKMLEEKDEEFNIK